MAENNICSDCGNQREVKYANDSCCKTCRSTRNKTKRIQKRLEEGKSLWGSGRSKLCSLCRNEKDAQHLSSGYCRTCNSNNKKQNTTKKRLQNGLEVWGSGIRKSACCKCGGEKERSSYGYCLACNRIVVNERRERNKLSQKFMEKEREKARLRYQNSYSNKVKKLAREAVFKAVKSGILIKEACEVCQNDIVDGHHDDYNLPLKVRWLCRLHHMDHHKNERLNLEN